MNPNLKALLQPLPHDYKENWERIFGKKKRRKVAKRAD